MLEANPISTPFLSLRIGHGKTKTEPRNDPLPLVPGKHMEIPRRLQGQRKEVLEGFPKSWESGHAQRIPDGGLAGGVGRSFFLGMVTSKDPGCDSVLEMLILNHSLTPDVSCLTIVVAFL